VTRPDRRFCYLLAAQGNATPITVANAKPRAKPYELRDHGAQGLHLAVQPTGHKSMVVRYRFEGRPRKLTLDGFPSLAIARRIAAEAMVEVAAGRDPAAAKRYRQGRGQRQRRLRSASVTLSSA
jgi:hypothetical protein